jgi:hypothetical protein
VSIQVLAEIQCEACQATANIKRRATGKKLLYIHCPNCGLDQRSGGIQQAKLKDAIKAVEMSQNEPLELGTQAIESETSEQWRPTQSVDAEKSEKPAAERARPAFKFAVGALLTLASIAGTLLIKGNAK